MSNNNQDWYDDDDFDLEDDMDETPQRSKGDDVIKKLRRAERAKDKQLKELQAELETLRKFQKESVVAKVLQEKGVNPKVAKFIPGDVDLSPESISSWLDDNAELFGVSAPSNGSEQSNANAADLAALRQMDAVTSGALNPDDINDAFSSINNAQSAEELLNFLYSQGAE
jgi:hypothetical protein